MGSLLSRYWFVLLIPAALAAALVLGFSIVSLVRLAGRPKLADLPLRGRQEFPLAADGPVVLCIEGPFLSTCFRGLEFGLTDLVGNPVPGRTLLFRERQSGFSRARLAIRRFDVPRAGQYVLEIRGLGGKAADEAACRVVLVRPAGLRLVVLVVGVVLGGGGLIASLVLFVLRSSTRWWGA